MTGESTRVKRDSVSPYLLMALREAPKPIADPMQAELPQSRPETERERGAEENAPQTETRDDVPPLARPGLKL